MMRKNGLRSILAQSFVIVLFVWPIVHVILSSFFELSSWKLGGWGMYASTDPSDLRLTVFVVGEEGQPITDLGPVLRTRLLVLNGSEVVELEQEAIPQDTLGRLARLSRKIVVMKRRVDMAEFLEGLGAEAKKKFGIEPAYSVLLLSELRFDVLDRQSYARTSAYLYEGGEVYKIGVFDSNTVTSNQLLAEIRAAQERARKPERS